ncbi:MAG: tRNA preQ1(34) S-adenosylmethionine ribosyltransferase-isomerase QueA [Candidatus Omnitrophota bacterium]|jgi:S-adenosylmethionine:tRNA ribosyltransferase-isomerase
MRLSDFDYDLPKELIAQYPLKERDSARLLVLNRKDGTIEHRVFKEITDYLRQGDLLALNDTKVLSCRLKASRLTGGRVEILLLSRKQGFVFDALLKPARLKIGEKVIFNGGNISATLSAKNELTFEADDIDGIYDLGKMPLPPYIKREPVDSDNLDYQTVYARNKGAVASPTAGLHFTEALMRKIKSSGVSVAYLTLHVGYATFKPVKIEDVTQHKMEAEDFKIPGEALSLLEDTKAKRGRVIAVGTTSCRALESFAAGSKEGKTSLFIYPGYNFKIVDCLLTNFHLPRTTLFMLVCAFAGERLMKKAYREAIERKYRFYSYGDAMLIL